MFKKIFLTSFLLLVALSCISAREIVLSVNNFQVDSKNPDHEFIGKGISLLVAGELSKSPGIKLLERDKLNSILEEQKFSLSDLADAQQQVKLGMLLSADYIIFGTIVDMGVSLIFSLRMVNVETGEITWQEELSEKLENYDYIAAYFANSILKTLNAEVEETIVAKIEKKEEKKAEAVVKLSQGIDAYDKGDLEKAKADLQQVTKLDPENEVAQYYLAALTTSSAKYRVETELYAATYNPASLGFIQNDQLYFVTSNALRPPVANEDGTITIDEYGFKEYPSVSRGGYAFMPVAGLGLALEAIGGNADMMINTPYAFELEGESTGEMHPDYPLAGGSLLAGYRITDNFALGLSALVANIFTGTGNNNYVHTGLFWSVDGGFLLNLLQNALTIDSHLAYSSKRDAILDTVNRVALFDSVPLILDNSVTLALFDRTLFLALKEIVDIYYENRNGYGLRLIPIIEYNFPFLALRAGYEYSHLDQAGRFTRGWGILGGLTLKLGHFELSGNYTLRQIPSKMLPGYLLPGSTLSISLSYDGIFFR